MWSNGCQEKLKESPYWEEPLEVEEQMEYFADLEMGWTTHDWESRFALDEETTDITARNNMGGELCFSVQGINRAIDILRGGRVLENEG